MRRRAADAERLGHDAGRAGQGDGITWLDAGCFALYLAFYLVLPVTLATRYGREGGDD